METHFCFISFCCRAWSVSFVIESLLLIPWWLSAGFLQDVASLLTYPLRRHWTPERWPLCWDWGRIRNRIQGNEEVIFSELSFVFHLLVLCGFFSPVPHILITPILMYFFLWPWNHDISCLPTSNITLFLFFLSHSGICKGRLTLSVFPSSPAFHINSLQFGCSAPHSTKSSLPT